MINYEKQLNEYSYQYIINLDNNKLEIYWYKVLINSYNFNNIPANWIEECNKKVDIYYDKWKKDGLRNNDRSIYKECFYKRKSNNRNKKS